MNALLCDAPSSQVQAWFNYRPPTHIVKRDGRTVAFHSARIRSALLRAGRSTGEFAADEAELLEHRVLKVLRHRFCDLTPSVEQVQDIVEQVLLDADYLRTFRACVAYRAQHQRLRDDRQMRCDVIASLADDLDRADWRAGHASGERVSFNARVREVAGKIVGNYWLSHVYPPEVAQAHRDAELHLHGLAALSGDRTRWSLLALLRADEGGDADGRPAAHLAGALALTADVVVALHDEWAGTQTIDSFDTALAPFVRADALDYAALRAALQRFIDRLKAAHRGGAGAPGCIAAFDGVCPEALRDVPAMIGGRQTACTYGELQAERELIRRAYADATNTDAGATPPAPGRRGNARRATGAPCGSIGVVTINGARLGHLHRGAEPALLARVDRLAEMARDSLEIKRKLLQRLLDDGRLPQTARLIGSLRGHGATIAVCGLDEMTRNFGGDDADLARRVLDRLRQRLRDFEDDTGHRYALGAPPDDEAGTRFARADRQCFADLRPAGMRQPTQDGPSSRRTADGNGEVPAASFGTHAPPPCAVAAASPCAEDRRGSPTRGNAARRTGPS